jgi:hypothetical protein
MIIIKPPHSRYVFKNTDAEQYGSYANSYYRAKPYGLGGIY